MLGSLFVWMECDIVEMNTEDNILDCETSNSGPTSSRTQESKKTETDQIVLPVYEMGHCIVHGFALSLQCA